MSNEQFEGHSAEIYAGAGNAPENAHVDVAEDGGEIDGTVEPTSDDSADDWGFEGKKRKLTREVLVGFAAIGVLVAVFAVVVAKSFFGDDDPGEKLAEEPPAESPGPESGTPDGDPGEFLPPGPGGPALTHTGGPIEPSDSSFGGEPPPTDIPDIPTWPDTSPDRTVTSIDPDEDVFGPSTPAPEPGNSTGEWAPGESPGSAAGTERPSGLFDSQPVASSEFPGTGDLPSPLDAPSGLPTPFDPTYETASRSGDPFTPEPPTDPLTGLPMPDPGGASSAVTTIDPAYDSRVLPAPDLSVPDLSTPVGPDSFVGTNGSAIPGPSFENSDRTYGQPDPGLGDVTPGYRDEPVAPIGALPDPGGYPPASDPGALPVIEPFGPSPTIATSASGDGFRSRMNIQAALTSRVWSVPTTAATVR